MDFFEANARFPDEKEKEYLAFCDFRDQGLQRTAARTARNLSVAPGTISSWRKKHDWDTRIAVIDAVVKGYVQNEELEQKFQENMGKIGEVADTLMARLEDFLAKQKDISIKDLYQATRALFAVTQIKENTSWYGRVIEALKHIAKTENAQQASEEFVKEQLPKIEQRTRDPEDTQ